MDVILEFILGTSGDPVEIAARLLLFMVILDSIFGFANALVYGARR